MKRLTTTTDKKFFTEFLQLYKDLPCLWDIKRVSYDNKEARSAAYNKLLEKYTEYDENATCDTIKRKIENLRNNYRKERKKELMAKENGFIYKSSLWYYELLSFLDEVMVFNINEGNEEPRQKRIKYTLQINNDHTYILPEEYSDSTWLHESEDDSPEEQLDAEEENHCNEESSTAFGRTVGLQLKLLDPKQRFIAEKLISDVIFNARLNRLIAKPPYHKSD